MIWVFLCQRLPWHHWVIEKRVSEQSRKLTCSCGRQYAANDTMGVILPWSEEFADFYRQMDARHRSSHTRQDRGGAA